MTRDREILNNDNDAMDLLDELARGFVTDAHGLVLGDLAGHRMDRYLTHWRVLHMAAELGKRRFLRHTDVLLPIGARVQDKQGIDVFQAAHVLVCDFKVNADSGLHTIFQSPIIRGVVKRKLFGKTNIVHRLVNYADRRCEANGWIQTFCDAVVSCLAPGADAADIYLKHLVPNFSAVVADTRMALEASLDAAERRHINDQGIYRPDGSRARLREQDFRVSKKLADPRVRAHNKAAVLQIFEAYRLGPAGLSPNVLEEARVEAVGWVELEREWRAKWA